MMYCTTQIIAAVCYGCLADLIGVKQHRIDDKRIFWMYTISYKISQI